MSKTIYLAGAMTARRDFGRVWREKETEFLLENGFDEVLNPCKFEETIWRDVMMAHGCTSMVELGAKNKHAFAHIMKKIEEYDIAQIDNSDVVLFYIEPACFKSDGTIYELEHCIRNNKDIVILLKMAMSKIPSWSRWRITMYGLEEHRLFYHWDDLHEFIKHEYGGK